MIAYAAGLLGMPVPPEVPFEEAELSPMARSFYGESKRVSNRRIKEELGVTLAWPDYRAGLRGDPRGGVLRARVQQPGGNRREFASRGWQSAAASAKRFGKAE